MPLRFRKLTQVSFSIIFSGQKKSNGGSNNPNRLSCNLTFKDESQHKDLESFNTKDSSDSKSHDSGIDSIEKPGKTNNIFHQSLYLKRHFRYSCLLKVALFQLLLEMIIDASWEDSDEKFPKLYHFNLDQLMREQSIRGARYVTDFKG